MNPIAIDVDGDEYDLVADRSRDAVAVYLDININRSGTRVALFRLRCAVREPQYESIASAPVETLMEMAMRRPTFLQSVRSALHWQAELKKINPEWKVSPIFNSWFPENYNAPDAGKR